jgi:hypothetical protein
MKYAMEGWNLGQNSSEYTLLQGITRKCIRDMLIQFLEDSLGYLVDFFSFFKSMPAQHIAESSNRPYRKLSTCLQDTIS